MSSLTFLLSLAFGISSMAFAGTSLPSEAADQTASPRMIGIPSPIPYPEEALRLHQQGKVIMTLAVNAKGTVTACRIAVTSGSPSLDKTSCDAVRKQRFSPARDAGGNKVDGTVTMPMTWKLPAF